MKCPECITEGKKSRVTPGGSSITLAYYQPYYDEDGVYHHHDNNDISTDYSCSNGHRWVEHSTARCPAPDCDFGK